LGDGDFVNRVLAEAREALEKRHALLAEGIDLNNIAFRVSELMGVKPEDVWAKGKYRGLWMQGVYFVIGRYGNWG